MNRLNIVDSSGWLEYFAGTEFAPHFEAPLSDPEHLIVEGSFQSEALHVQLKKIDESKFLLVNRGFNWIQEYPFNR